MAMTRDEMEMVVGAVMSVMRQEIDDICAQHALERAQLTRSAAKQLAAERKKTELAKASQSVRDFSKAYASAGGGKKVQCVAQLTSELEAVRAELQEALGALIHVVKIDLGNIQPVGFTQQEADEAADAEGRKLDEMKAVQDAGFHAAAEAMHDDAEVYSDAEREQDQDDRDRES